MKHRMEVSLTSGRETLDDLERFLDGCGFRSRRRTAASTLVIEPHQAGPRTRMNVRRAHHALDLYLDVWVALHPSMQVERATQPAGYAEEESIDRGVPVPARP